MATLEGLAHNVDVTDTFKAVVCTTAGQLDQMRHQIAFDFTGVNEVGHAELLAPGFLVVVHVYADDLIGADHAQTLDHVQANATQTEYDCITASSALAVLMTAPIPADTAPDVANFVEGGIFVDFGERDFRQDTVIGEG